MRFQLVTSSLIRIRCLARLQLRRHLFSRNDVVGFLLFLNMRGAILNSATAFQVSRLYLYTCHSFVGLWLIFFSPPSCCTHKLPNRRYLSKSTLLKRSCQIDLTSVRKLPKIVKVRPSHTSMQCKTGKTARLCASHYWTAENWSHKFQTLQLFVSNI